RWWAPQEVWVRAAAEAACTASWCHQGLALPVALPLCADTVEAPRHLPIHQARWVALGNRRRSVPISARTRSLAGYGLSAWSHAAGLGTCSGLLGRGREPQLTCGPKLHPAPYETRQGRAPMFHVPASLGARQHPSEQPASEVDAHDRAALVAGEEAALSL